jgi:hypothetical protein
VWIALSLATMTMMAAMLLMLIQLGRIGVEPALVLFYLFGAVCLLSFAYLKFLGRPLYLPGSAVPWIVGAAGACFFGNLCGLKAMNLAPNPGYPTAIEGAKMLVVVLASIGLFAAEFSLMKGLGVLCCAIGVALLCL